MCGKVTQTRETGVKGIYVRPGSGSFTVGPMERSTAPLLLCDLALMMEEWNAQ